MSTIDGMPSNHEAHTSDNLAEYAGGHIALWLLVVGVVALKRHLMQTYIQGYF